MKHENDAHPYAVDKQTSARWRDHLKAEEIERLSVIEDRMKRNQATFSELLGERYRIMRRCITRARRAKEGNQDG